MKHIIHRIGPETNLPVCSIQDNEAMLTPHDHWNPKPLKLGAYVAHKGTGVVWGKIVKIIGNDIYVESTIEPLNAINLENALFHEAQVSNPNIWV